MTDLWGVLLLGVLLGMRHAFDADHLIAVTTIVSEYRSPLRAIWIGVSWGLGHTTTLFLVGALLLLLGLELPERVALYFEFLVGVVLVILGVQIVWSFRRRQVHVHTHHEREPHIHFHSHADTQEHAHHEPHAKMSLGQLLIAGITPGEHRTAPASAFKPFFRVKSYLVGTVHGLAGSAALMLLVLTGLKSAFAGLLYILVFGLGSVISMGLVSIFISLPFSVSSRLPQVNLAVRALTSVASIFFGLLLMYQAGIGERLLGG